MNHTTHSSSKSTGIFWAKRGIMAFVFFILMALFLGTAFTALWNYLMPAVFGLGAITYWQGLGILLMSRILFGNWGGRRGNHPRHAWKDGMRNRWASMSDAEKGEMRAKWSNSWTEVREEDDDLNS